MQSLVQPQHLPPACLTGRCGQEGWVSSVCSRGTAGQAVGRGLEGKDSGGESKDHGTPLPFNPKGERRKAVLQQPGTSFLSSQNPGVASPTESHGPVGQADAR